MFVHTFSWFEAGLTMIVSVPVGIATRVNVDIIIPLMVGLFVTWMLSLALFFFRMGRRHRRSFVHHATPRTHMLELWNADGVQAWERAAFLDAEVDAGNAQCSFLHIR